MRKELQELRNESTTCYKTFNKELLKIINIACSKDRKNPTLLELKDKYRIAMNTMEDDIIKEVGPHLWKHKEYIVSKDATFFMETHFDNTHPEIDIAGLTENLRRMYVDMTEIERTVIWQYVGSLLTRYAQFLKNSRQIKKTTSELRRRA